MIAAVINVNPSWFYTGRMRDGYFVEKLGSDDSCSNMSVLGSCWCILDRVGICKVTVSNSAAVDWRGAILAGHR